MFHCRRLWNIRIKSETGFSLLETLVALALLGIIASAFLGALATSSNSRLVADEHVTARIMTESQMEDIKQQPYASAYNTNEDILDDYPGYEMDIAVNSLGAGYTGIQKVVITVSHRGRDVHVLEGYKVDR